MLLNAAAHRPCRDLRTPQHRVLFTACGLRPEDVQRVSLANEPCAGSAVLQISTPWVRCGAHPQTMKMGGHLFVATSFSLGATSPLISMTRRLIGTPYCRHRARRPESRLVSASPRAGAVYRCCAMERRRHEAVDRAMLRARRAQEDHRG